MTDPDPNLSFYDYCNNPPVDSALAAAIAFGIDPTITFYNMFALTVEERVARASQVILSTSDLLGAIASSKRNAP